MLKKRDLERLFYPKTIAVIGASPHLEKVGNVLLKKLEKFKGNIIPINPIHQIIEGKKTYPSVIKYKNKIDLAIIATPAKTVNLILKECGKKKIKNIIIISAGFSEVGNTKLENVIINTAKKYQMNLLGPNCFGVANLEINLDTTFSNTTPKKGNIAFISQSGALWSYISDLKIGFSKFASLGNMGDLSFKDFIQYLNKDKKTKKIILYVEKLKQGKKFIKACNESKKEIIVIKAGKTEKGKQAAISHTGSLATDYRIYSGAFKQAKIKQTDSLAKALRLSVKKFEQDNTKNKSIIITNAGGAGALIIDKLGNKITKTPIDLLGTAKAKDYEQALNKLKNKKDCDLIIVILTPQKMSEPEKTAKILAEFPQKEKIIAFFLGDKSIKKAKQILDKNKIKAFTKI